MGKMSLSDAGERVIFSRILLLCVIFLHHQSEAATVVGTGATISTNTQWLLADSPFLLQGGLTVALGATLTIDAGVQVYVADAQGINVLGTLQALGQNLLPVSIMHEHQSRSHAQCVMLCIFSHILLLMFFVIAVFLIDKFII